MLIIIFAHSMVLAHCTGRIVKKRHVKLTPCISLEITALCQMSFKTLIQLNQSPCLSKDVSLDLFWHTARFFPHPRRSWNGHMTSVSKGDYPSEVSVNMLPIIDMDPTNLSCIYSTLNFIAEISKELQTTPIVSFDQPTWLKATEIVHSSNLSIVLLLGGFHTMSFAGGIRPLMRGSGSKTAFKCIYGKVTVSHLFSGKAIAKAFREYFLTESSLIKLLLKPLFPDLK